MDNMTPAKMRALYDSLQDLFDMASQNDRLQPYLDRVWADFQGLDSSLGLDWWVATPDSTPDSTPPQ